MATLTVVSLPSWASFVAFDAEAIQHGSVLNPSFLFRGQPEANWSLRPSIARIAKESEWTAARAFEVEEAALRDFIAQGHLHLPAQLLADRRDSISWWIAMQHCGAPTRLLDWTRSFFVAAYFAVASLPGSDGAVWMVKLAPLKAALDRHPQGALGDQAILKAHDAPALLYYLGPHFQTDRMAAQQTAFTLSPVVLADHAPLIEAAVATVEQDAVFLKIVIPHQLKLEFLQRLRHMNITARTLFPGIDGLGKSIDELARAAGP